MSEEKHRSSQAGEPGSGSSRNSGSSDPNRVRVRRKKKKKKSGSRIPSEFSSRAVTIILILLGALFIFSLYYIVVNINVKSVK